MHDMTPDSPLYRYRDAIADRLTQDAHAVWCGLGRPDRDQYAMRLRNAVEDGQSWPTAAQSIADDFARDFAQPED